MTLLPIKLLEHFQERSGTMLFLSDTLCVKYGSNTSLSEAATMQFIAKHTAILVPHVYCAFARQNRTYIVMERLPGQSVGARWFNRPEESKAKLLEQLKKMVEEIRRLTPPADVGVANVDGGIVDWETAGWYPSYWEYSTTLNVNPQNESWRDEVDRFLEPKPEELEIEKVRLQYFGDF
jgi:hypothetical protein